MKKVFQIKLKSITKVFAMVMALSLVTFTGCKSYDEDIDKLNTDLTSLKTDLTALNTATQNALQLQITTLNNDITALKARVTTLEQTGATDAEVAAAIATAKTEIMSKVVTLEAFNAYKTTVDAELASLKTKVDAAATKADLTALATRLDAKVLEIENTLTALGAKVNSLQTSVNLLGTQLDEAKARISKNEADIAKNITDLAALKADVEARLALLEGVLKIKNGKSEVIDKIQLDLTAQKALIDANTAKIADLQAQLDALKARTVTLETKVAQNTTDIAKNTADIAKNTADITAIRTDLALINANLKAVANAMHLNFAVLSSRLSSLVYAGDLSGTELSRFYVNGIEAINFSTLMSKCDPITPAVTIAYHLNPSFIKEADIETGNMAFVVKKGSNMLTSNYLAVQGTNEAVQVAAIYDHIDQTAGIIYVKVSVNDYNTLIGVEGGNYVGGSLETFRSIALQIPLSQKAVQENAIQLDNDGKMVVVGSTEYPANRVITSDYVRLYGENMLAQTDVYLARNNAPTYSILPQTLADAKALSVKDVDGATVTAPQVVTLPYGKTLDLINEVKAIFSGAPFDVVKYGLKYKFDLLDENGNVIVYNRGSNNTDQQQFIKINDAAKGTIEAKVFTQAEIAAAQGRTPIVRVWMYNEKNASCPVLLGFVKVFMAEKPLPTPITVPFTFADAQAGCADVLGRTTVQQMNEQLYNKVGLSKEEFHSVYTLSTVNGVQEIKNPDGQTTDTWLLQWTLTAQQIWTSLMTANPATFTQTVEYVPSLPTVYPKITITFTRKFTKPADLNIAEGSLIKKYWYDMNGANNATVFDEVKHNVNVPDVNESTTTNCTIKNDLSQAFLQNADKSLKGFSNYEYYFVPNVVGQPAISQPVIAINGVNYQFTPSTDGKQLLNGSEVIATINPFVANVGDILELNRNSATAKMLLNNGKEVLRARIALRTKYCPELNFLQPITVNGKPTFDVVFVRPIKAAALSPDKFVDGKSFGQPNTYIEIAKMVSLSDWRDYSFASYPNLYGYYGVTSIALSTTKSIETNLNGTRVALSTFPSLQVAYATSVPGVLPAAQYGYLTYQNNGNVIGNSFELYVPVTITYYWGEIVNTWVTVTVDKTVGPSSIKRK